MKHLANGITIARIMISIFILLTEPLSVAFFVLYIICGVTDMVDGTIARMTHSESKTGALLDSISDVVFLVVVVMQLAPILWNRLPVWALACAVEIVLIRIVSYAIGARKFKRFASLHTILNKVTGGLLFILPLLLMLIGISWTCAVVCLAAGISAMEELAIIIQMKEFDPDRRGYFIL